MKVYLRAFFFFCHWEVILTFPTKRSNNCCCIFLSSKSFVVMLLLFNCFSAFLLPKNLQFQSTGKKFELVRNEEETIWGQMWALNERLKQQTVFLAFFFFFPVIGNNFIWLGAVSPAVNQKVTKSALANLPEIDTL